MTGEYVKFYHDKMEIEVGKVDDFGQQVESERFDAEELLEELQ